MNRVMLIPTIALLLVGAICFWSSRGEAQRDSKAVVIVNAVDPGTLDPARMSWQNDIRTAMGLWEGLLSYKTVDGVLTTIPGAASHWEISADKKTYTFHIRPEAKWSNGDPLVAENFVFAWKRALDPFTAADYANFLFLIKGGKTYYETLEAGRRADWKDVAVQAPDPHTIVIELENPCTYYLDLLAFPVYFPLHEASMKPHWSGNAKTGYLPTWTHPPSLVTNGPFKLAEWEFKRYMRLTPNENYWDRAAVQASAILVKASSDKRNAILSLTHGDADILTFVPDDFGPELQAQQKAGQRNDVHYRPVFGTYYYAFNCKRPPFDDKRVRKALSLVIDKEKLTREVKRMGESPTGVLVPVNSVPFYTGPKGLSRDVELARKLLADAGYPGGKGFPEFEFLYNNEAGHDKVAQAVGQMWQTELGITPKYLGVELNSFRSARKNHNFAVARGGWYGDYTDPSTWLDLCYSKDNNNDSQFNSPEFDALLAKAAAEGDRDKRFAILRDAERLLVEDEFPYIPLYQYSDGYMFDENKVGGIGMDVRLMTQFKYLYKK